MAIDVHEPTSAGHIEWAARLAMQATQLGVLGDKVLKNYVATEFLYDYLKDKKL